MEALHVGERGVTASDCTSRKLPTASAITVSLAELDRAVRAD
jgi:hypothetical protein